MLIISILLQAGKDLPIELPTSKLSSLGVLLIVLIAIILIFLFKICSMLCGKNKNDKQ